MGNNIFTFGWSVLEDIIIITIILFIHFFWLEQFLFHVLFAL